MGLLACTTPAQDESANAGSLSNLAALKHAALRAAFPTAQTSRHGLGATRLYGAALSTGNSSADSAEQFRRKHSEAMGIDAGELVAQETAKARGESVSQMGAIGLMPDERTGEPRFWLYRYKQNRAGLPVYGARLHTLVSNDASHSVVWASSTVRDLSKFTARTSMRLPSPDRQKALKAIASATDFAGKRLPTPTAIKSVSSPELVVYAGPEDAEESPRMAVQYVAETSPSGKWNFVADADSGDVLRVESAIVYANVTGAVTAKITQGDVSMECASEVAMPFPFAEVDGQTGESAFTDATGSYSLTTSASGALTVTSLVGGRYFDVVSLNGALDQLSSSVVPPGTADFLHDANATDPRVIAQANGYSNANEIRAFLLKYVPTYPTISTQLNFPVNVNLSSSNDPTCPGNAFYDGSSLNLCLGDSSYTNTSFASVTHHEYGHHIVAKSGSGQGAYGEGMSDAISVLFAGAPQLGLGFFLNDCTNPLRNANNTCQYSASSCSSCGSEIHDCGNLLSGTIWSIRQALAQAYPDTYADIINKLTLSSILLHTGSAINSQIAIDMLTLDDNDGNLANGTPHYAQICAGFTAHGMTCPAISTDLTVGPATGLAAEGPIGGPFVPASVTYTLTNMGPSASLNYQVTANPAASWLTISNASGSIALNQSVQVTVAIDQTVAASLARASYSSTVQITNLTNGVGSTTRTAQLQVGVPLPIYTETFDVGTGTFAIDSGSTNLWHVSSNCASAQTGHSAPKGLYFGIDSTCNYSNSSIDTGTATSVPVTISDTSVVKLRLNYFLGTERLSSYDHASLQVSINGGAYSVVASNYGTGSVLQDGTAAWQTATFDISSLFAGLATASLKVRVAFDTVDSIANAYAGFMVDDVQVLAYAGTVINNPPTVNAGADQSISQLSATLSGSAKDDGLPCPPSTLTVTWSRVSGPGEVTFANPSSPSTVVTFPGAGVYTLRLTANDSALTSSDELVVTVGSPANQAPTANAGVDQTIILPAAASLSGTATDDGLPNPPAALTFTWSMVSGPGTVTFANPSALSTTATFSAAGSYTLRLTVSDGVLYATDDVVITVATPANQPPTANAGPDQTIILPAAALLAGSAGDDGLPNPPAAITTTWSMVSGPGTVTFANANALSTSASFSAAGSYTLRLTVSDSVLSTADDLIVTVNPASPVNQAPTVNAGPDQAVTLPGTAALAGNVSDDGLPTPPAAVTTTWSKVSGPGTVTFANTSALSTTATFSAAGSYTLRLTASDSQLSATDDVIITVSAANQAPTVNAGPDQAITLPGTATLAGTASDDGLPTPPATVTTTWSKVSGPGTVTFANASALSTTATFSAAGSYTLRLTASDSALSSTDDVVVTVSAAPVNKAPVVNAGADQAITLPATVSLAGTATDDGLPKPPAAITTTWSKVSGTGTVTFANASALSTTATFSAAGTYTLRLTASDSALSSTDDVVVTVSAASPCSGLCTNPVNFTISGSFQSGNLGTGAVCYQTTSNINGGNCGNFVSPRTLKVNGTTETCNGGNWTIPAKRNGGYCIQTTAGNYSWAYFTAW